MHNYLETFTNPLLDWYQHHGRTNLPWQTPKDPYRVWISEIMLQQTQVKTVIPYFNRFMESFPTVQELAIASEDHVFSHWSGLGYYSRARNLHRTAQVITNQCAGVFPTELSELQQLPGIGPSTAAAVCSLAFNQPTAILDGNVKRLLCRYFKIAGFPEEKQTRLQLWSKAQLCMSHTHPADYTQAIMDLGATVCTPKNPNCAQCPLNQTCLAFQSEVMHDYPNKRPTKQLPEKHEQFLVLYNPDGKIYLEKRPTTGIWSGLWCLPATELSQSASEYVTTEYPFSILSQDKLTTIKHTFSHFRLHIHAIALQIGAPLCDESSMPGKWVNSEELKTLGIAKPVQSILELFWKHKG